MFIGRILMHFNIETNGFNWGNYKSTLIKNSDVQKFDDMFRLILTCTTQEKRTLFKMLNDKQNEGKIRYGSHTSEAALVTCMIKEYSGMHFHFIDGDEGGYAMAALDLSGKE